MQPLSFRRLAVKAGLALFAFTLLFAGMIVRLSDPRYRLFLQTEPGFRTGLVLDITLLTAAAVAGEVALERMRFAKLHRAMRYGLLLVVGSGALSVLPVVRRRPDVFLVLWCALVGALALVYARRWERVVQCVRATALVFLPLPAVLFAQLFSWPAPAPCAGRPLDPPPPSDSARARPVVLLLFDEWSYRRSVVGGEFLPRMVHLRRLAGQSFVFHQARSVSASTSVSVPGFLFQTDLPADYDGGRPTFLDGGRRVPTAETPSLFLAARARGYHTTLIGWHLPYEAILGGQVDVYHNASGWPGGDRVAANMLRAACENLNFSHDPLARLLRRLSIDRVQLSRVSDLMDSALRLIKSSPGNGFSFIHWSVPHAPYVLGADGSVNHFWNQESARDYTDQILYVDRIVGRLTDELRAAGKFDDALIVVLSDHSWRRERDQAILAEPDEVLHVPLLVKWPGQRSTRAVDTPVSTARLGGLIEAALDGGDEAAALRAIRKLVPTAPRGTSPGSCGPSGDDWSRDL